MAKPFAIVRLNGAIRDLQQASHYLLEEANLGVAARFLRQAEHTFRDLATMPFLGSHYETNNPNLAGLRQWQVKGFANYLIYYRVREITRQVQIVRVLHGTRDVDTVLESM